MNTARPSGWGVQDYRKKELCRLLEVANVNLSQCPEYVSTIFDTDIAQDLKTRIARIQDQIRDIKKLVRV